MAIIRKLSVRLMLDSGNFAAKVKAASTDVRLLGRAVGAFRSQSKAAGGGGLSILGGAISTALGTGLASAVSKGTSALEGFFATGIKGAVDLVETQNKVKEIFKSSSQPILDNADAMAKAYGLSKGELLDAGANFGQLAKGVGQSDAAAAAFSNTMVQLAADAASFNNTSVEVALEKIRSGLSGEAEPLKAFGVMLTEDQVKAEALAMGLTKGKGKLDEASKMAARASLIQKGLASAQGDLARTFDSTSNRGKAFAGTLTNLATDMGTALLPAINAGMAVLNDFAATAVSAFESFKPTMASWVETITSAIGQAGVIFKDLPLYAQIVWIKMQETVANIALTVELIPENLARIGEWIANNWVKLLADGLNAVVAIFTNLGNNIKEIWYGITHPGEWASGAFVPDFKPLLEGFQATADALPEMAKPAFVDMGRELEAVQKELDAKAQARAGAAAAKAPEVAKATMPAFEAQKAAKAGEDKYKGVAAATAGSKEAGSAIARAINVAMTGGGDKQLNEAKKQTKLQTQMAAGLTKLAASGNGNGGLAEFPIGA